MIISRIIQAILIAGITFFATCSIFAENTNNNDNTFRSAHDFKVEDAVNSKLKDEQYGKIIALNKITATSEEITLKVGDEKYFGNIKIKLHKCLKNPDPYNIDNYLLLTVTEYKIDEDPNLLFQGWITSSSISLSTFEHPIYEIFGKNCW